jgi:TetR/AcrR family transcriptional regulator, transcriptional repressor for nem operon
LSDTREYIIDQAYNLFLNHSYEAVSISEISKAIGFSKGALYHHFSSKEELFKAVIDKHINLKIFINYDAGITITEYINMVVKHSKDIVETIINDEQKLVTLDYLSLYIDAFRHYPEFSREKSDFIHDEIKKIEKIIRNGIEKGEIRSDVDAGVMAMNFFSLSLGMVADLLYNKSTKKAINTLQSQFNELYKLMKV